MNPRPREENRRERQVQDLWAFALTSAAVFMIALDNLVVTTALPVITQELGGGIETLE
jgi:hypothetical protein